MKPIKSAVAPHRLVPTSGLFLLLILVWLMVWQQPLLAADAIGKVIVARGAVSAADQEGETRQLKRRSQIYIGDTVITGSNAQVQIRFIDGALVALQENSAFKIATYELNDSVPGNGQAVMELIKGGFRSITGTVGKGSREAYRVKTPVASIGVRGTHYSALLLPDKSLVAGVWLGGIWLRNEQGDIDLGIGEAFNYTLIELGRAPKGLFEVPAALQALAPDTGDMPVQEEQKDADEKPQSSRDKPSFNDDDMLGDISSSGTLALPNLAQLLGGQDLLPDFTDNESRFGRALDLLINPPQNVLPSEEEFTHMGFVVGLVPTDGELCAGDVCFPVDIGVMAGGISTDPANERPLLGINFGIDSEDFSTLDDYPPTFLLRQGIDRPTTDFQSHVGGYDVSWGRWNVDLQSPIVLQGLVGSSVVLSEQITETMIFTSLSTTDVARLAGNFNYGGVVDSLIMGSRDGQPVLDVSFHADFDQGLITDGKLSLTDGELTWFATGFDGTLQGAAANMDLVNDGANIINDQIAPDGVDGTINGAFVGDDGTGFAGGFSIFDPNDTSNSAAGVFLIEQQSVDGGVDSSSVDAQ